MKSLLSSLMMLLSLFALPGSAQAADYPDKNMTWVVPLAPGGPADTLTRNVAQHVAEKLGGTIVIENLSGAGGTVGATQAAREPADGYHFLMGHMGFMAAAPALYKQLNYDPVKDFVAVFRFPNTPAVLLVPEDSPFQDAQALIEYAKAHPGELNFGTAGVGSVSHLVAELFAAEADIDIQTIPYKGNAPAVSDLMAGRLDAIFDQSNTALANIRSGKVKALGIGSREPLAQFKDVPTLSAAIPGFEAVTWYGLYAPVGTPEDALKAMESAYLQAMQDSTFTDNLVVQGMELLDTQEYQGAAFGQLTQDDGNRWREIIEAAGIQPR